MFRIYNSSTKLIPFDFGKPQKQNQARIRLMQKQLLELQETEKHLKSTVFYLEQQLEGKD